MLFMHLFVNDDKVKIGNEHTFDIYVTYIRSKT